MKIFPAALFIFLLTLCITNPIISQDDSRWQLTEDGGIEWLVSAGDSHMDHIEISGFHISSIVRYGVDDGQLKQSVHLVFPMLRTIPNDTHASLSHDFTYGNGDRILINGKMINEKPERFYIRGILSYRSLTSEGIEITHYLFPSTDKPLFIDRTVIRNKTDRPVSIELTGNELTHITDTAKGVYGAYRIRRYPTRQGLFTLNAGECLNYAIVCSAYKAYQDEPYVSPDYEWKRRMKFVDETFSGLTFESPDPVINTEFSFAQLRALESIYDTKGGLMHGPGGGRYYAAIWANDQAEYANPFFPFTGNLAGNESAMNSFRHFARYMNPGYDPIPSSIIAEGTGFWNGAGDRGDMAMIAYGAARFALASGDRETAYELWPLIEWCLEYCNRKINDNGVVSSDSDELEGRFPAGDANLNTSSLYYDALISAACLGEELGIERSITEDYNTRAVSLEKAIEDFFGRDISGFETYRYYEGNDVLRAWICTPLTTGIYRRSEGTIDALFSKRLWTDDGLASETGSTTFWDRATLYALRGVFAAGETRRAMPFFLKYSKRRLLGEHVPYPVEAYPEGNQRHLSAESALYCRIINEGIFGIRPLGLDSFLISPRLPDDWDAMALRNIRAFNNTFDIEVRRENNKLSVIVFNKDKVFSDTLTEENETIKIKL